MAPAPLAATAQPSAPGRGFAVRGVVEGFYGPLWEPAARYRFIDQLAPFGPNRYLYAPKFEGVLAAQLLRPISQDEAWRLGELAAFCRERAISPWAGLHLEPPFDPAQAAQLEQVAAKVAQLAALGFEGFALLFDDIPSSLPGGSLAQMQGQVCGRLMERAEALGLKVGWWLCPSRYTLDPILEKEYGAFEPDYLARLHQATPAQVAWFWTGPKVCSPQITLPDLEAFLGGLPRPLVLWDNYPVNDVAMVNRLHLGPLTGRAPELHHRLSGYLFNPLLQPGLGVVPAATCLQYAADPAGYQPAQAWRRALEALLPPQSQPAFEGLEALTRRSALNPFVPNPQAPWEALKEALEAALAQGALPAPQAGPLQELARQARLELPPEMALEASPWLERLEAAARLFRSPPGPARDEALEAARQGRAFVLGRWYTP